jgi:hypothetical protein
MVDTRGKPPPNFNLMLSKNAPRRQSMEQRASSSNLAAMVPEPSIQAYQDAMARPPSAPSSQQQQQQQQDVSTPAALRLLGRQPADAG